MIIKKILFPLLLIIIVTNSSFSGEKHWVEVDYYETELVVTYACIDCYDEFNCVAFGNHNFTDPRNRVTTDGGKTWTTTLIDDPDKEIGYKPASVSEVWYQSENLCIALCDSGYYWRSTDRCQTWERGKMEWVRSPNDLYARIEMYDEKFGVAHYTRDLYITTDGGINWEYTEPDLDSSYFPSVYKDISVPDERTIILLVYNQKNTDYIIRSTDRGKTWVSADGIENERNRMGRIFFFNEMEGYACGSYQYEPPEPIYKDMIYYTSDGGESWDIQLDTLVYPKEGIRIEIHFHDRNNGYAVGWWNTFWETTNGGETWERDTSFTVGQYSAILTDYAFPKPGVIYGLTFMDRQIFKYDKTVSVEEKIFNEPQFSLYPNPAADHVSIRNNEDEIIDVAIYDILNRKMLSRKIIGRKEMQIDVSGFPPGFYFVICDNGHEIKTFKFIKK